MPSLNDWIRVLVPGNGKLGLRPFRMGHVPRVCYVLARSFHTIEHAGSSFLKKTLDLFVALSIAEQRRIHEKIAVFPGTLQAEDAPIIFVEPRVSLETKRATANQDRWLPPAGRGLQVAIGWMHHKILSLLRPDERGQ
jgi:hypothetical protein